MASRTNRSTASDTLKSEVPSAAETRFLRRVYKYTLDNDGEFPSDAELMMLLHMGSSGVSMTKKRLKDKEFLLKVNGPTQFAEETWTYCKEKFKLVPPTSVPVRGNVTAGQDDRSITDSVVEDWREDDRHAELITIPFEGDSKKVCALRVVGASMEHERIYQGDIVIVEEFEGDEWPRLGEMIVTYYLPSEKHPAEGESLSDMDSDLVGPVLKFYFEEYKEKGRRQYVLGWRRDKRESPGKHRIETGYIRPIGRVVGVYRLPNW
jgi:hypothetical protein